MSVRRDFPDIPPVWAAAAFALQAVLGRAVPDLRVETGWWGLVPVGAGLGLIAWSLLCFRHKATSVEPRERPAALIVEGPFRLNRNPIYTGMALALVGTALLIRAPLGLLAVPAFLWIVTRRFVLGEEAALRAAFGPEADRYIAATRRW